MHLEPFATLSVQPAYGRTFSARDDKPQANAATILSWDLFQRRFGGDPAILGKTVLLNEKPYTVIGVLPRWLTYPDAKTQLWLPAYHQQAADVMRSHGMHKWNVVARLKVGVTDAAARSDIDAIQGRIYRQYPNEPAIESAQLRPLIDSMVHKFKTPLYVLLGAVGCVLHLVSQPVRPMMYFSRYEGAHYSGASLVIRSAVAPMSLALPI